MKSPMDFHRHFHRVDFATFAIFALCEFLSLFMGLVIGGSGARAGDLVVGGSPQPTAPTPLCATPCLPRVPELALRTLYLWFCTHCHKRARVRTHAADGSGRRDCHMPIWASHGGAAPRVPAVPTDPAAPQPRGSATKLHNVRSSVKVGPAACAVPQASAC